MPKNVGYSKSKPALSQPRQKSGAKSDVGKIIKSQLKQTKMIQKRKREMK